jgi:hypothetical protein
MTLVATGNLSLCWRRVDVDGKRVPEALNLQRDNSTILMSGVGVADEYHFRDYN